MPRDRWSQHLEIETPEHVALDYELAGLGSRGLAAILDTIILSVLMIIIGLTLGLLVPFDGWLADIIRVFLLFLVLWGYFTLFEAYWHGQTPGKRWMGIRVVHDTGHGLSFSGAAIRNLLRMADFIPPPYFTGGLMVALHPRAKRLGDLVAGTVVVRDQPQIQQGPAEPAAADADHGAPELSDDQFRLLRGYRERAAELLPAVRSRLAAQVLARLSKGGGPGEDAELALELLYRQEAARRRSRFGAGRRRGHADRFVAQKEERWKEFERIARQVNARGLDGLNARALPDFAARYREIAADLARARTYGAEAGVIGRLERLVATGHNALYRRERDTGANLWHFLMRESPAAVLRSWRYVVLAATVFILPGIAGYLVLRQQPDLALQVLPDVMLERAEAGAERIRQGIGYFEAPAGERPLVASSIITNNVGVAFRCFAGGIFAGVGALIMLALNGLMIGVASGHFANSGLLGYLWTFVAGHGMLELFAIWVAGAAGFLLGRALIAPGDLSRGDALVLSGRTGIRLVAASSLMLLVAGAIEGFISASNLPLGMRIGASIGSAGLLLAYLLGGLRTKDLGLRGEERGAPIEPNAT